jgi:hypothetical protein
MTLRRVIAPRWDIRAELSVPCAGSKVGDSFLSLTLSCSVGMGAHGVTAASLQAQVLVQDLYIHVEKVCLRVQASRDLRMV